MPGRGDPGTPMGAAGDDRVHERSRGGELGVILIAEIAVLIHPDLAAFGLPGVSGTVVQFNTVLGPVNVELFTQAAPLTTANFLTYMNGGAYTDTLFNRAVQGFVVQGGGYTVQTTATTTTR